MAIHRKISYAPRSRRCTGRREAQSREPVIEVKKKTVDMYCIFVSRTSSFEHLPKVNACVRSETAASLGFVKRCDIV
jgi:hypothetical protein